MGPPLLSEQSCPRLVLLYLPMSDCIGENSDVCSASLELKAAKELDTALSKEEALGLFTFGCGAD